MINLFVFLPSRFVLFGSSFDQQIAFVVYSFLFLSIQFHGEVGTVMTSRTNFFAGCHFIIHWLACLLFQESLESGNFVRAGFFIKSVAAC
jgi:GMP synthase-like glutamine amidotransferase